MTDPLISSPTLSNKFDNARPLLSPLAAEYMSAKDLYAHEKFQREQAEIRMIEGQISSGQLSPDHIMRQVSVPASILKAQEEKKKAEKAFDQWLFDQMMEDMQRRLAELDELLAQRHKELQGKYGQDVIGGMAETYLTEEELRGLKTDKERMRALADKFLDKDGQIKDKYKHLEEAKYVRDWVEAEELRPEVEEYNRRKHLTASEREKEYEASQLATTAENKNKIVTSTNNEYQEIADSALDSNRTVVETTVKTAKLGFV